MVNIMDQLVEIKKIILDEIFRFLKEEYEKNEIIDYNKIDLQNEYDKLNNLLFDNKLPKIPLKWAKTKRKLGYVKVKYHNFSIKGLTLYISTFYKITYQQFLDTLAHEMIHIYQIYVSDDPYRMLHNMFYDPHGQDFVEQANRINNMGLGFHITKTNEETLSVSNAIKKDLIAIIFDLDGQYYLSVTTPKTFNEDLDVIIRIMNHAIDRGKYNRIEINAIETQNPELLKYPIKRSYKRAVAYTKINNDFLEELLNDKIIKTITLEKGKKPVISEETMIIS